MRFRIKHLMLLIFFAAVALVTYAPEWQARREYEAIAKAQGEILSRVPVRGQVMFKLRSTDILVINLRMGTLPPGTIDRLDGLRIAELHLEGTNFTDSDARALGGIRDLRQLFLAEVPITDFACESIASMRDLEVLSLAGNNLGDAGLAQIEVLQNLRRLDLRGTNVTDAGIQKLQQSLPRCRIRRDHVESRNTDR